MIAVLSPVTFSLSAISIELNGDDTDLGETVRRVNRSETLDGGVAINDFGSTQADRTMYLAWDTMTAAGEQQVKDLVAQNSTLRLAIPEGLFLVAPESFRSGPETSTLTVLVLEQTA